MSVKIIVDSTVDMAPEAASEAVVVPLTVNFGSEEYTDGVTIDNDTFYKKLSECADIPTTSQATPENFARCFAKVKEAGDDAVVVTISSKLSGTCQSAVIAAADFEGIYVVDSENVTASSGVIAEYALRLARRGMAARDIAEELEKAKKKARLIAMVDTLEYLKRGGRISRSLAFAGTLLDMKPLISMADGELAVLGKVRGAKQAMARLRKLVDEVGGVDTDMPYIFGYTGTDRSNMMKFIEESVPDLGIAEENVRFTQLGSVVGTHAGPGAIGIAFFTK